MAGRRDAVMRPAVGRDEATGLLLSEGREWGREATGALPDPGRVLGRLPMGSRGPRVWLGREETRAGLGLELGRALEAGREIMPGERTGIIGLWIIPPGRAKPPP